MRHSEQVGSLLSKLELGNGSGHLDFEERLALQRRLKERSLSFGRYPIEKDSAL